MGFKSSSLFCLALFLAISSSSNAFNITKLLDQNPDFATFNKYLTETKLVSQINSRNTITVLAVSDGALSAISGKSPEVIKAIISTHVVLDYFDVKKLMEAQRDGHQLTTLYQASGLAVNQQGFLKVKLHGQGSLVFGSAVSGAPVDVELVRTVLSQPYNISILQVTKPIVAPGIDPQSPPSPSNAQAPSEGAKAPAPTKGDKADAPSPSEVTTDAPADAPANAPADAPAADAPSPSLAPGPGDEAAADAETPSSSSRTVVGLIGAVMCFASLLVVM